MSRERPSIVVVDDEEPARRLLREYLQRHGGVELAAECANGFEAVKAVHELQPELLLLDVQMPKLNGFEVLELLEQPPAVIFTTAHDEYALRAFEVHAVDYLLKPFPYERLAAALERVGERLAAGPQPEVTSLAAELRRGQGPLPRVLVRDGARIHVLPAPEIDYIEARDDYVLLRVGAQQHRKQQTLGQLETELDPRRFVRIHRSYLLNLDRLERLELYAKDSRVAILTDGSRLPVSRAGYARLRTLL